MTDSLFITCIDWYCIFLECILWLYTVGMIVLQKGWLREVLCDLAAPLLYPIQKLMKRSVMQSKTDFSAIILFMVILFIRTLIRKP
ncbi:MAG: hypothetical protein HDT30_06050 [Clostridiales bacterium]|nr:hypothetical protein [Clostridiales bacterium]MBD5088362.1 hypothetical protein [Clostridiales bacterium]